MSKILTIPSNIDEIEKTKELVDGFIIGIEDLCVNINMCIKEDNLSMLNDLANKDIFICMNKNLHNNDLESVKKLLIKLNNYNIKGVLYYDVGLLNIYKSLILNYDLVCFQEHLTTNYNTINYWYDHGVKYTYLSSDITQEEITTISKNTKSKLMVNMFGYLPMFVSKRHIVKNYLDYFNLNDDSKINYIEKEGKIYPIVDNATGTSVYSNNILNGIKFYINIGVEYIVLNSFQIDLDKFIEIINMFRNVNRHNALEYNDKINSMFTNVDNGFLNIKTIYKVKNNEK